MDPLKAAHLKLYLRHKTYAQGISVTEKKMIWRSSHNFTIANGETLYYVKKNAVPIRRRVVIGEEEKLKVLREAHENAASECHSGINSTYHKIAGAVYWPGLYKDVASYCKRCEMCCHKNTRKVLERLPTCVRLPAIFDRWVVDTVGPLNQTVVGNQYMFIATEYVSRWVIVSSVKEVSVESMTELIIHLQSNFGIPKIVIHDQAAEFNSCLNKAVCNLLEIKVEIAYTRQPKKEGRTIW
ncbi:hypothetical protein D918_07010 [Trichuris suis]|nr:hypothetical protein D918_07010 [Trichuris suis]